MVFRPIAEWIERIDRGDKLKLRAAHRELTAGRLAGMYIVRDEDDYWTLG